MSIGNSFPSPPKLNFSDKKRSVAFLNSKGITIETPIINLLCEDENFEDKIAYIISHELAHHYLSHTWMRNTGLGYASSIGEFIDEKSSSKDQRKLAESQADLFGGFLVKLQVIMFWVLLKALCQMFTLIIIYPMKSKDIQTIMKD